MIILIRCNDIVSDPRAMKYVEYLRENKIEQKLIGWDRDGVVVDTEEAVYWHEKAGFNVGGMKAAKKRVKWMKFVIKTLLDMKLKAPFIIHACDLDSAFPANVYNKLVSKNRRASVIFDVFDWFSATLYDQNKLILGAFQLMERFSVKHSNRIIICEQERQDQIQFMYDKSKLSILPNIPMFDSRDFLHVDLQYKLDNNLFTFAYVGGFAQTRCINEIITAAENGHINLLIAGFGDAQIEGRLDALKGHPHIRYYGKVQYKDGMQIMYNSDVVYAMYAKSNPNHIYAAPNKFYEALFLGKPIFSTKGTIVETKVLNLRTGYVSEESYEEILSVISTITMEKNKTFSETALKLWDDKYCNYTRNYLENEYRNMMS